MNETFKNSNCKSNLDERQLPISISQMECELNDNLEILLKSIYFENTCQKMKTKLRNNIMKGISRQQSAIFMFQSQ